MSPTKWGDVASFYWEIGQSRISVWVKKITSPRRCHMTYHDIPGWLKTKVLTVTKVFSRGDSPGWLKATMATIILAGDFKKLTDDWNDLRKSRDFGGMSWNPQPAPFCPLIVASYHHILYIYSTIHDYTILYAFLYHVFYAKAPAFFVVDTSILDDKKSSTSSSLGSPRLDEMKSKALAPNVISFTSALSGCILDFIPGFGSFAMDKLEKKCRKKWQFTMLKEGRNIGNV